MPETTTTGKALKPGSKVSWSSHGGTAKGKVVRKLTSPTDIKGHHVAASTDNPEYLVETDDGKRAAHKPSALKQRSGSANKNSALRKRRGD